VADGALVREAKSHLSDEEIIEVPGVIGLAFTVSCITVPLDIAPDDETFNPMDALKSALSP
jgi:hypothetical protein